MADEQSPQPAADVAQAGERAPDPAPPPEPAREKPRGRLERIAEFVTAKFGPPPYRIELGRIAAVVVVPVFCWVFFTTASGMIDIMRRDSGDWVGLIGAFVGTTAILVMLASTSWSLGADFGALIARKQFLGERIVVKTATTFAVFVFVFSISAFFSFTYYYTNIFKLSSKKIVAELQPMELAADILLPASKQIGADYDAETARIVATPGMRTYLDSLDSLLRTTNLAGDAFRARLREREEAAQRAATEAARRAAAELQDRQAAARQLEEALDRLAKLDQTIADLEPIIKSKQEEIASLTTLARQEDQLAVDASKGLDGLGAACGSNCESHRAKATAAKKRVATIRETLTAPTNERAEAQKRRDSMAAQIVPLRQKAESAAGPRPGQEAKEEAPPDFAAAERELADLRDQIRADPTWPKIRQAKQACETVLGAVRQANVAIPGAPADFDCEPKGREAQSLLAARDEVLAGRAAFDQKCSLDGAFRESIGAIALRIRNAPDSDRSAASNGFNEAKRLVDDCVVVGKAAGLSEADTQALLKRSDIFLRTHSMERNRFELAREAFTSLTPDATMAIGVAVAQDAFMFVMKLLSEIFKRSVETRRQPPLPATMDLADSEADEPEIRLLKALLRVSRPRHGNMSAFDAGTRSVADLPEAVRDNLFGLLNRLVREQIAYIDRKGVYILDNRTLAEVETRLSAALKRAGARARREAAFPIETASPGGGVENGAWRRRRSALDRYLSSRFPPPASDEDEDRPEEAADSFSTERAYA